MEQLEINVRRELSSTKKPYLREIDGILEVFIPVNDIGLHQVLQSSNSTTVHLKRCSTKARAVFQLSLEDRVSNRKVGKYFIFCIILMTRGRPKLLINKVQIL